MSIKLSDDKSKLLRFLRYAKVLVGGSFVVLILLIIFTTFVFTVIRVQGKSMEPTYHNNQLLAVNLLVRTNDLKVGDAIIVRYSGNRNTQFIKRIKHGPGEVIIYQNKQRLLAEDEYFIQGDNIEHSTDSRTYGPIKRNQIVGKVIQ